MYFANFPNIVYDSVGNDEVGRLKEIFNFGVPVCPVSQATQQEDYCEHCVPWNGVIKGYI